MRVSIVILSWNGREMVLGCVRSALASASPGIEAEVIVSDNGSRDGTPEAVEREYPGVTVVRNGKNLGFSAGMNRGAEKATGEYLLLLNSDAELTAGALKTLVDALERDPGASLAAPRLVHADGTVQRSAHPLPDLAGFMRKFTILRVLRRWSGERRRVAPQPPPGSGPVPVEYVIGAVILIRRSHFPGGRILDEDFFFYYEDTDLCRRIRDAGRRCLFCPDAEVRHLGKASSDKDYYRIKRVYFRSALTYVRKHHGREGSEGFWVAFKVLFFLNLVYDILKQAAALVTRAGADRRWALQHLRALVDFALEDLRPSLVPRVGPGLGTLQRLPCVLCGGRRWRMLLEVEDVNTRSVPGTFDLGRCLECGLHSLNPPPSPEVLARAYAADYEPHTKRGSSGDGVESPLPSFWNAVQLRPGMRVLDVGCGGGRYLDRLRKRGCEVWGIEPDPEAAASVRGMGFPIHVGTLDDAPYPPPLFDLVSLVHVIEHVPDPVRTLGSLPRFVESDGEILLITPNIGASTFLLFGKRWFPLETPRHLHLFTPRTLTDACRRAGLRVVRWRVHANSHYVRHSFDNCPPPVRALGRSRAGRTVVRWYLRWANLFFRDGEEVRMVVRAGRSVSQGEARAGALRRVGEPPIIHAGQEDPRAP
jgi:hypothetical protein